MPLFSFTVEVDRLYLPLIVQENYYERLKEKSALYSSLCKWTSQLVCSERCFSLGAIFQQLEKERWTIAERSTSLTSIRSRGTMRRRTWRGCVKSKVANRSRAPYCFLAGRLFLTFASFSFFSPLSLLSPCYFEKGYMLFPPYSTTASNDLLSEGSRVRGYDDFQRKAAMGVGGEEAFAFGWEPLRMLLFLCIPKISQADIWLFPIAYLLLEWMMFLSLFLSCAALTFVSFLCLILCLSDAFSFIKMTMQRKDEKDGSVSFQR